MGTLASTRLVYGDSADVIENGSLTDGSVMVGTTDYNYNNVTGEDDTDIDTETESVSESTTTTTTTSTSVSMPKKKAKFDIVPLIAGGGIAYLAHTRFMNNKYSWAYVLGGFTLGYVGGSYLSKAITK